MSLFTEVIAKVPKRNAFNLSFENLLTSEFGQIIPIACKEVIPNDKFKMSSEVVVKTAPMLAPVFSRIDLYLHYFFVPCRLLQSDWEDFITTGVDGLSSDLTPPTATIQQLCTIGGATEIKDGSLMDYFNIPKINMTEVGSSGIGSMKINMLPFLAYQKCYSDWFKDELLDSFEFEPVAGGAMSSSLYGMATTMRYRSWKKDYFTSARPNTQLGAAVGIPMSGEILSDGFPFRFASNSSAYRHLWNTNRVDNGESVDPRYSFTIGLANPDDTSGTPQATLSYESGLSLEGVEVNVNDLRRALKLQQWQERNMRGGNRYIENIYHHFGVKSSDARLQRSELLGGRKIPVVVSEVTQMSSTGTYAEIEEESTVYKDTTPIGSLAGKGGSIANSGVIKWHAEEHGFILCLASIMPKAAYMQGLPRQYWRMSYLDYAWPLFGNLGEQEVYKGEIFLGQANPDQAFGYQSRYAEYKFSPNEVHGSFRKTMAYWHNARIFDSAPSLNNDFVQLNGGQDDSTNDGQNRIFAYLPDGYGHFYLHVYHNIKVLRALPKYGIPSI